MLPKSLKFVQTPRNPLTKNNINTLNRTISINYSKLWTGVQYWQSIQFSFTAVSKPEMLKSAAIVQKVLFVRKLSFATWEIQ